jgi:glucose-6-phosphate isomerase
LREYVGSFVSWKGGELMEPIVLREVGVEPWVRGDFSVWLDRGLSSLDRLCAGRVPDADMLGWRDWPVIYDRDELVRMQTAAEKVQDDTTMLVNIGIGGSYLGARAGLELLLPPFHQEDSLRVYWAGHHLSGGYLVDLMNQLDQGEVSLHVVSKSGTTTEPGLAFRILRGYMEKRYGTKEAAERIYVTTDPASGALRTMADDAGYRRFTIPPTIGGRYSVLTPCGLFPMAACGIPVESILAGAQTGRQRYLELNPQNPAVRYAVIRQYLYQAGKKIEAFIHWDPRLEYLGRWFQQLFAESEGKEGKGLFPVTMQYSTDLHSMGQYMQEGERHVFETVLWATDPGCDLTVPRDIGDLDGLNYLAGKAFDGINHEAARGTRTAHMAGGVPVLGIEVADLTPASVGEIFYFFMVACTVSAIMMGVNPFDQPGVEAYKQEMFRRLGKPGFES